MIQVTQVAWIYYMEDEPRWSESEDQLMTLNPLHIVNFEPTEHGPDDANTLIRQVTGVALYVREDPIYVERQIDGFIERFEPRRKRHRQ